MRCLEYMYVHTRRDAERSQELGRGALKNIFHFFDSIYLVHIESFF